MQQNLLSKCVHKVLTQYDTDSVTTSRLSIDYLLYFRSNCTLDFDKEKVTEFDCAYDQMRSLGINTTIVESCYNNSFIRPGDVDSFNELLDEDATVQEELGIYLHPGLTINNITYRGYLEGQDIKEAICSSFAKPPIQCGDPTELIDEMMNDIFNMVFENKKQNQIERMKQYKLINDHRQVRAHVVFAVLGFLVILQLVFFLWYRKRRQQ